MNVKATKTPASAANGPPLRIDATIQLAWGLTLVFSSDAKANTVGSGFLQELGGLRALHADDPHAQAYLDNLSAVLSGYLRTSGFERDVYVSILDTYSQLRDSKIKNVNDVADLASVSSGSFLSKVGAFLGFGTLSEIVGAVTSYAQPTPGLPFNLNFVLFGGLAGLALVILVVRLFRERLIAKYDWKCFRQQSNVWQYKMKPGFANELKNLIYRLRPLVKEFYPDYGEVALAMDDNQLESLISSILPDDGVYRFRGPKTIAGLYGLTYPLQPSASAT